jgi:hypothetical protein
MRKKKSENSSESGDYNSNKTNTYSSENSESNSKTSPNSVSFDDPSIAFANDELLDYAKAVSVLAENRDSTVFSNSGPGHATIVLSNIFRFATDHIRMFAGDLNGIVSKGDYLIRLHEYLSNNNRFSLILEKELDNEYIKNNKALSLIYHHKKNNNKITVWYINNKEAIKSVIGDKVFHFCVADNEKYRFETDTEKYTAVCSFNDSHKARRLIEIFNSLKNYCTEFNA